MAVFFWYLVKSDLYSVSYCAGVHWTNHLGTRNTRPWLAGHPVPVHELLDGDEPLGPGGAGVVAAQLHGNRPRPGQP